jgi:hypothetical protein
MKKILIIAVLLVSLVLVFASCKGTKTCPAYGQNDTEHSESVDS